MTTQHRGKKAQGSSLATVMMVVAMMMTLAFTVVAIAFNHLSLSNKSANSSKAKHLAEATLAKAIDSIVKDQQFGTTGTATDKTVRVTLGSLPAGSEGVLTFDPDTAAAEGVLCSTNNRSEASVPAPDGKLVPGESFHLVAKATVKNSTSRLETILTVPKFPFSVAAEGAIRSNGGLTVASVKAGVPYDLDYPLHEDDLEPGHLVSNSKIGDAAVVLTGENKIYGDLQSSSGVTIESDTAVLGEIRTNSTDESLPDIQAVSYDPELEPGLQEVHSGAGQLEVEGYNKSYGDLTVDNGIVLNGGVLYVDGDLTVSAGGVTGKGALITTGNLTIFGDGESFSDNEAALIADGNISLQGASSDKAKFSGLIYTNSQLKAENLRLAGVFVAAGTGSGVEFSNTEVYEDSSKSKVEVTTEATPFVLPTINPDSGSYNGKPITATVDSSVLASNLENYRNPNTGPTQPEYLFKFHYAGSSTGYAYMEPGNAVPVETTGPDAFLVDGGAVGMKIFGQPVSSVSEAESVVLTELEAQFAADGVTLTATDRDNIKTQARRVYNSMTMGYSVSIASADYTASGGSTGGGTGGSSFEWSLDLSDFFNRGKHIEVMYWSEYRE